jgi:UDP-N-acetylglucosamine--N-acetylmuramyl-(pentapeptide) pyrophosphoryl-undecaprenol N-acetylglucosamine transferase
MAEYRIIISGGGSGGHIFPAIAIANAIKAMEPQCHILFVGARGKMEMEKIPQAGYQIEGLWISGLNRNDFVANLLFPFKVVSSLMGACRILNRFKPHVAVGVGGYASGPLLFMAAHKGIPCLIQEQNSYAGITNKILGRKAHTICVAYDGMEKFFPKDKIIKTGNPVREEIMQTEGLRNEAYSFFGLKPGPLTLLILGGSQGALSINRSVSHCLARMEELGINILWQTGKLYYEQARQQSAGWPSARIKVYEFINRMNLAYAVADIILSRAGAGTVSELCMVGKPVLLVPLPTAAEDHQTMNALTLVRAGAAMMIPDTQLSQQLIPHLKMLIEDPQKRQQMANNIRQLAMPDAARLIAREVLKLARIQSLQ